MRSKQVRKRLQFDPELERTVRNLRKAARLKKQGESSSRATQQEATIMAEIPQPLERMETYLAPNSTRPSSSIVIPEVDQNFEIKPSLISLVNRVPFAGEPQEDPHTFIDRFLRVCNTVKGHGVTPDALKLRLFPFAVKDGALQWLERQPENSIHTWDDLVIKFLDQFFPVSRYNRLVGEITNFVQGEKETFGVAWRRFKELLRRCPQQELRPGQKIAYFFKGMKSECKLVLNTAAGGSIRMKTPEQTMELIELLSKEENETEATQPRKGLIQIEGNDAVLAEQRLMSQQIANLNAKLERLHIPTAHVNAVTCEYCKGEHETNECEILMETQRFQVNGVWFDRSNQQGGRGGNFNSYRRNQNQGGLDYKSNNYLHPPPIPQSNNPTSLASSSVADDLKETMNQMAKNTNSFIEETRAHAKKADEFMAETRSHRTHQESSIRNLEHQMGQISKQLSDRTPGRFPSDTVVNPKENCNVITVIGEPLMVSHQEESGAESKEEVRKETLEELLKSLEEMSLPPIKSGCEERHQRQIAPKLKDPGEFLLPCEIKRVFINNAFCDLGSSINMMPLSLAQKLNITTILPTGIKLSMADCSVKKACGVARNVVVWIANKFIVPTDFVILEMERGKEGSLILGRPFLASAGALIDVPSGTVTLRVKGHHMTFPGSLGEKPPDESENKRSRDETSSEEDPEEEEVEGPSLMKVQWKRRKKEEERSSMDHQVF